MAGFNLAAGTLAYFDSLSGLVPVKVISLTESVSALDQRRETHVEFQVTGARGAWKRGCRDYSILGRIVPRPAVYVRDYKFRIRPYSWEV